MIRAPPRPVMPATASPVEISRPVAAERRVVGRRDDANAGLITRIPSAPATRNPRWNAADSRYAGLPRFATTRTQAGPRMLLRETVTVALGALLANKARSLLTMLGIVIGVASVIAMVALGTGAANDVRDRIAKLGTTVIQVDLARVQQGGVGTATVTKLTVKDAEMIAERSPNVVGVNYTQDRSLQVQWKRGKRPRAGDGDQSELPGDSRLPSGARPDVHRGRQPRAPASGRDWRGGAAVARKRDRGGAPRGADPDFGGGPSRSSARWRTAACRLSATRTSRS